MNKQKNTTKQTGRTLKNNIHIQWPLNPPINQKITKSSDPYLYRYK